MRVLLANFALLVEDLAITSDLMRSLTNAVMSVGYGAASYIGYTISLITNTNGYSNILFVLLAYNGVYEDHDVTTSIYYSEDDEQVAIEPMGIDRLSQSVREVLNPV